MLKKAILALFLLVFFMPLFLSISFLSAQQNNQKLYGIGARIDKIEDGILIKNVLINGSAFQAGINNGDIILEVDGIQTKDIDLDKAFKLLLGKENTYVNIKVKQTTNEVKMFKLKRVLIKMGIQGRIDYIFSSPSLSEKCITAYPVINNETDNISDHYPVAAEFMLDNGKNIKIMTYNIYVGFDDIKRKQRFIEWIKKQNVDILALNELYFYDEKILQKDALKWGHSYSAIFKANEGSNIGITSNREIKNITTIIDPVSKRGILKCDIDGMTFFVLHFYPEKDKMKASEIQNKEANTVLAEANNYIQSNCIILGDFNALSPDDLIYHNIQGLDYSTISLFIYSKWIDLVNLRNKKDFLLVTCPTRLKKGKFE